MIGTFILSSLSCLLVEELLQKNLQVRCEWGVWRVYGVRNQSSTKLIVSWICEWLIKR
jgi:hypothetical protein